jgi:hypothetical protein
MCGAPWRLSLYTSESRRLHWLAWVVGCRAAGCWIAIGFGLDSLNGTCAEADEFTSLTQRRPPILIPHASPRAGRAHNSPRVLDGNYLAYLGCVTTDGQSEGLTFGHDADYFGGGAPVHYAPAFANAVVKGRSYISLARTGDLG